jgi:hypothetical protein
MSARRKEGHLEGIAKISPELHLCFHEEGKEFEDFGV